MSYMYFMPRRARKQFCFGNSARLGYTHTHPQMTTAIYQQLTFFDTTNLTRSDVRLVSAVAHKNQNLSLFHSPTRKRTPPLPLPFSLHLPPRPSEERLAICSKPPISKPPTARNRPQDDHRDAAPLTPLTSDVRTTSIHPSTRGTASIRESVDTAQYRHQSYADSARSCEVMGPSRHT
ncbi:hypothetical protein LY76DRAFT_399801 [Colletotrichum caudatum]|nr:hypothetical protein LY76DRAFT_399801 [Colletotrichum caudatum]